MAHTSSLVFAGIAPHPPIMVPEVGRESSVDVQNSINAMAELTARVISSKAETVIIISPHAPLEANAFIAYGGPQIHGDFANFRAPAVTVQAELDGDLLDEIASAAAEQHLVVHFHDATRPSAGQVLAISAHGPALATRAADSSPGVLRATCSRKAEFVKKMRAGLFRKHDP